MHMKSENLKSESLVISCGGHFGAMPLFCLVFVLWTSTSDAYFFLCCWSLCGQPCFGSLGTPVTWNSEWLFIVTPVVVLYRTTPVRGVLFHAVTVPLIICSGDDRSRDTCSGAVFVFVLFFVAPVVVVTVFSGHLRRWSLAVSRDACEGKELVLRHL